MRFHSMVINVCAKSYSSSPPTYSNSNIFSYVWNLMGRLPSLNDPPFLLFSFTKVRWITDINWDISLAIILHICWPLILNRCPRALQIPPFVDLVLASSWNIEHVYHPTYCVTIPPVKSPWCHSCRVSTTVNSRFLLYIYIFLQYILYTLYSILYTISYILYTLYSILYTLYFIL